MTQVPSTEFKVDSVITVAEGALFNATLIQANGSQGVDNPAYAEALLIATINAVRAHYGFRVSMESWRRGRRRSA